MRAEHPDFPADLRDRIYGLLDDLERLRVNYDTFRRPEAELLRIARAAVKWHRDVAARGIDVYA